MHVALLGIPLAFLPARLRDNTKVLTRVEHEISILQEKAEASKQKLQVACLAACLATCPAFCPTVCSPTCFATSLDACPADCSIASSAAACPYAISST
ncbi:hypothetical protein EON63_11090 [archaeon]|nr:MAG: hypothetical protein EON63_11090 [archaeon]